MNLLEITDVESIKPGRPFSRSSEGRLINPGPAGGAGGAGFLAAHVRRRWTSGF